MRKITAGIGSLAMVAGSAFFVATAPGLAASAETPQVTPSLSAEAVSGQWEHKGLYTAWQTDLTPPTVGDGFKLGELDEPKVVEGTTETTDWVRESPGEGWVQVDERTVEDEPAWTEEVEVEPGFWSNFEPTDTHAPFEGPPTWPTDPRGKWSEPKYDGGPQKDAEGVFQNGQGHGSWYFRAQAQYEVIEHPAVTHPEFIFELTTPDVMMYRWQILEWVSTPDEPGENGNGGEDGNGNNQPGDDKSSDSDTRPGPAEREKDVVPDVTDAVVPTEIDAGL
jgi:hypothetical protein